MMCFDMQGTAAQKPRHASSKEAVFVERSKVVRLKKPFQQDTLMDSRRMWDPSYDLVNLAGYLSEDDFSRLVSQLEEITAVSQW